MYIYIYYYYYRNIKGNKFSEVPEYIQNMNLEQL